MFLLNLEHSVAIGINESYESEFYCCHFRASSILCPLVSKHTSENIFDKVPIHVRPTILIPIYYAIEGTQQNITQS